MRQTHPPRKFCETLQTIFGLDFVPIPFVEKEELSEALARRTVEPPPDVDGLWEEYRRYDSILAHDGRGNIYRFIRSLSITVRRTRKSADGALIPECLSGRIEWPDGQITRRRHASTVSEKFRWRDGFLWKWKFSAWRLEVRRGMYEELDIRLPRSVLGRLKLLTGVDVDGKRAIVDRRTEDTARPGISTYNFLLRAEVRLPRQYWAEEYREEWFDGDRLVKTIVHSWIPEEQESENE